MSLYFVFFFFFKQKTAYEMRISDWSSDVCFPIYPITGEAQRLGMAREIGRIGKRLGGGATLDDGSEIEQRECSHRGKMGLCHRVCHSPPCPPSRPRLSVRGNAR